jgi:chemotaxis signal transduction protein
MNDTTRFVTFPLGDARYALDSCQVKELVLPSRVYSFPHTMQSLEGVLVRRGTKLLRGCAVQLRRTQ